MSQTISRNNDDDDFSGPGGWHSLIPSGAAVASANYATAVKDTTPFGTFLLDGLRKLGSGDGGSGGDEGIPLQYAGKIIPIQWLWPTKEDKGNTMTGTHKCLFCGTTINIAHRAGRIPEYCSPHCRNARKFLNAYLRELKHIDLNKCGAAVRSELFMIANTVVKAANCHKTPGTRQT